MSAKNISIERLEKLLLVGLASPEVEATPAFWRKLHARARKADRDARRRVQEKRKKT